MQRLGLANTPKTESRLKELLWPDVNNEVAVRTVCHTGMWASFFIAGLTTLFVVLRFISVLGVMDAVIFVGIGFGIRKFSRIAAVFGLLLYLLEQIASANLSVLTVILTFIFIGCVRATFALARMKKQQAEALTHA
jgi:hypothetical protein